MCAKKTDKKSRKSTNGCFNGMEAMMKSYFSRNEEAVDCCAQLKEKCGFGVDSRTDCLAMFRQMQDRNSSQEKGAGKGKGPGCCA
jgi:hypothetical protein